MTDAEQAAVAWVRERFSRPDVDDIDAMVLERVECNPSFAVMLRQRIEADARYDGLSADDQLIERHAHIYAGEEIWHFSDEEIERLRELGRIKH